MSLDTPSNGSYLGVEDDYTDYDAINQQTTPPTKPGQRRGLREIEILREQKELKKLLEDDFAYYEHD